MTAQLRRLPRTIFAGFWNAIRRFPFPIAAAVAFTALWMADNHGVEIDEDLFGRLSTLFSISFFWFLAGTLFAEGKGLSRVGLIAVLALGEALIAWPLFTQGFVQEPWRNPHLLFLGLGFVLLGTIAPFLRRNAGEAAPCAFMQSVLLAAGLGLLIALVFAFGGLSVLFALEELFAVDVSHRAYNDVWVSAWALIWPVTALNALPRDFQAHDESPAPRWLWIIVTYVLVPLVLIYLALLYGYLAKIVLAWELPRGQVGYLVSGFAAVGVTTHYLAQPFRSEGRAWVRFFLRGFYVSLWGPLLLLWMAVTVRIGDYGITEGRYFLLALTIWLTFLAVVMAILRGRLILVPLSLSLLLIAAGFGPWGAYAVSSQSQMSVLKDLLAKEGMFEDGLISKASKPVAFEARKRISSVLSYLLDTSKRDALLPLMASLGADLETEGMVREFFDAMGLAYVWEGQSEDRFSVADGPPEPLDVSGYQLYIPRVNLHDDGVMVLDALEGQKLKIDMDLQGGRLIVSDLRGREVNFDLAALARALAMRDRDGGSSGGTRGSGFEADHRGLKVKLYVRNMTGDWIDEEPRVQWGELALLVAWTADL